MARAVKRDCASGASMLARIASVSDCTVLACTTDKPSPVDHCLGHIEMCVSARARADLTLDELVYELSERRRDLYGGRLLLGRRALTGHLPADQPSASGATHMRAHAALRRERLDRITPMEHAEGWERSRRARIPRPMQAQQPGVAVGRTQAVCRTERHPHAEAASPARPRAPSRRRWQTRRWCMGCR